MNWMSRIAIFAVLGAILSSAVLVGCGGGDEEAGNTAGNATASNGAASDAQ